MIPYPILQKKGILSRKKAFSGRKVRFVRARRSVEGNHLQVVGHED